MGLQERTLEPIGGRCEACGASLSPDEVRLALEAGGPALCVIHASELTAALESEASAEPGF